VDHATAERSALRAIDVGCGEGWMTERLARRCAEVLAVDLSPVALARARERCGAADGVRFANWDLLRDRPPGEFDLVVAMGVLEVFRRPTAVRLARRRVIDLIKPGGHLIVSTTKQSPVVEGSRWASRLGRGGRPTDAALRASGRLIWCEEAESETHLLTLYQRR
jgi:2-polyprenyl-3-methyl-5-hydroxy-6-metoxy-1,4-benzoquinol methylase